MLKQFTINTNIVYKHDTFIVKQTKSLIVISYDEKDVKKYVNTLFKELKAEDPFDQIINTVFINTQIKKSIAFEMVILRMDVNILEIFCAGNCRVIIFDDYDEKVVFTPVNELVKIEYKEKQINLENSFLSNIKMKDSCFVFVISNIFFNHVDINDFYKFYYQNRSTKTYIQSIKEKYHHVIENNKEMILLCLEVKQCNKYKLSS